MRKNVKQRKQTRARVSVALWILFLDLMIMMAILFSMMRRNDTKER